MSIFRPLTAQQLKADFVYRGWIFGLVPVYVGDLRDPAPNIATRNGVPEFLLDVMQGLFDGFCIIAATLAPDFEPSNAISITGRLDGKPLEPSL